VNPELLRGKPTPVRPDGTAAGRLFWVANLGEVTVGGTPRGPVDPPKPFDVTDGGPPLSCACAAGTSKASAKTATVAGFSRFTSESYSSLTIIARSLYSPASNLLERRRAPRVALNFCLLKEQVGKFL